MEKEDPNKVDPIMVLPENLVLKILLLLGSPKDRVRVSLVSKSWRAVTHSLPFMDFNMHEFIKGLYGTCYHRHARKLFYNYVERTVTRFCEVEDNVHTFKLLTMLKDDTEVSIINKCLESILKKNVKVLDIDITSSKNLQAYRLPIGLSSSYPSSLTSLKMSTNVFPLSFTNVAALKFLKVLHLNLVPLHRFVIMHLALSCRYLEELNVEFCPGLKEFHVYGARLNKVRFLDNDGVERIDIEAPYLRECHLFVKPVEGKNAPPMNMGSLPQLRTLELVGTLELSKVLSDSILDYSSLENLSLCLPNRQDSLKVSSPPLRKLVLYTKCELEEININTPNLILFILSNAWNSCGRDSGELNKSISGQSKTRMECDLFNEVDPIWFHKMWQFLRKTNRFRVLKLILRTRITPVDCEQLKVTRSQPYELEHVELELETIKDISVVDAVLLFCRPGSLSVMSNFYSIDYKGQSRVVKLIYDKLLQQEDQGHTSIRIEWSDAEINIGSNSMLTTFSDHQLRETVTFIKEKVVQEEENNDTVQGMQLLSLDNALN